MEYPSHNKEHNKPHSSDQHHPTPSNSELLSSAKIVANAAKSKFQNVDKNEVAGAAENLLHAASDYGKLDEKGGLGKYVGQAEDYLHKYYSSHSTTTTTTNQDHSTTSTTTTTETIKPGKDHPATTATTTETFDTKPGKDHQGHSGGGYGEYIKMAEGLLNKHGKSGGDEGQSGGKYGEYIKVAEGMLKKHSGSDSAGSEHDHNSGSGYGDYAKMAGDFLKK